MQEKSTAKDVSGSLNGGYRMLDFIEFRVGQKQPMATYPFTEIYHAGQSSPYKGEEERDFRM